MCRCGCGNCGLGDLDRVYGLGLISSGLVPTRTTAAATFSPEPAGTLTIWSPAPSRGGEPLPLPADLPIYIPPRNEIIFGVPLVGPMPVRSAPPGEGGTIPMPGLPLPPDLPPAPPRETAAGGGVLPVRSTAPAPTPTGGGPASTPSSTVDLSPIPQSLLAPIPAFPWKWLLLIGGGYLFYSEFIQKGGGRRR